MDTKERLLDTAERLFADRGFSETSVRQITSEAGVNLGAINYHFDSKETLLAAVFERRFDPVNRERLRQLDLLQASATVPELEQILFAFLGPPFRKAREWGEAGQRFMRLIGRTHSEPNLLIDSFLKHFDETRVRFTDAFQQALPHLTSDEVLRRMHYVIGAMAHTFVWRQAISCLHNAGSQQPDSVLRSLVSFATAGMQAAMTEPDIAAPGHKPSQTMHREPCREL